MKDFTDAEKKWLDDLGKSFKNGELPAYRIQFGNAVLEVTCREEGYTTCLSMFGLMRCGVGLTARNAVNDALGAFQGALTQMQEKLEDVQSGLIIFLISED